MNRPRLVSLLALGLLAAPSLASGQLTTDQLPARTFSEFAGTWVRDESQVQAPRAPITQGFGADPLLCTTSPACTPVPGFDPNPAPEPPDPQLIITTSPTEITVARIPRNPYGSDVFRFDGLPTNMGSGQGTVTLAAGSLLLTKRSARLAPRGNYESITVTSDLMSVSGDVLTIERQYFRIVRPMDGDKVGHIALTNDGGDARVKMTYRRQAVPAQ
jgi:hypothetical protein